MITLFVGFIAHHTTIVLMRYKKNNPVSLPPFNNIDPVSKDYFILISKLYVNIELSCRSGWWKIDILIEGRFFSCLFPLAFFSLVYFRCSFFSIFARENFSNDFNGKKAIKFEFTGLAKEYSLLGVTDSKEICRRVPCYNALYKDIFFQEFFFLQEISVSIIKIQTVESFLIDWVKMCRAE